jgi:hypothetical protein
MGLVHAIDVASYQPRDLTEIIREYQPAHVICHLYTDVESVPWEHSAAQIESALANGCTVGGYVFLYPGTGMIRTIISAIERCASIGLVLPILWLDVESYNGTDITKYDLQVAVGQCEVLETPCGIYSSRYMWSRIGNPSGFAHLPAWIADYNGRPDLDVIPPPSLPNVVAHQYRGDPLDLNVILEEYTGAPSVPAPPSDVDELLHAIRTMGGVVTDRIEIANSVLKRPRLSARKRLEQAALIDVDVRELRRIRDQYAPLP